MEKPGANFLVLVTVIGLGAVLQQFDDGQLQGLFFAAFLCHQFWVAAIAEQVFLKDPKNPLPFLCSLLADQWCQWLYRNGLHFLKCFSCFEA